MGKLIKSVEFDKDSHTYIIDGEIAKLSVTELLAKHNLAPDYSKVNQKLLKDSADYGTTIHEELEHIALDVDYEPKTSEGESFKEYIDEIVTPNTEVYPEKKLGLQYKDLVIGGTADLILINRFSKEVIVADHKTTSSVHTKAVTWQVNLLDYMAQFNIPKYKRATKFYCYHYSRDGKMAIIPLKKIADEEIEKLLEDELNNKIYEEPTLEIENTELALQAEQAEKMLYMAEKAYKEAKANAEKFREKLCQCFEEQNIKSWESPNKTIKITYVEPTTSKTVDSAKLKENYPEIYNECLKETTKKGYVKVTTKLEA